MTHKNTRFIAADIEDVDREKIVAMIHQFIDIAAYELKQAAEDSQTVFEIETSALNSKILIAEMTHNNDILTALVLALQTGIYQEFTHQKLHNSNNSNKETHKIDIQ